MEFVFAISDDWEATLGLLAIFGVAFPALVTGLLAVAVIGAMGERRENEKRQKRR